MDGKKNDDDAKKLKRRQYQAKRKQSMPKDSPVSKKRPRKVGRPEDDYDGFLDSFMTQLRQLSPIGIVEPELGHSHTVCPVYGTGDFSKLNNKTYNTFHGDLSGAFGRGNLPSKLDFYNSRPYTNEPSKPAPKPQPTHRGFYCQEFATPKLGTFVEKVRSDNRTPTPVRETDTPDTIVSASSPECGTWDNITMYPGLKYIDDDFDRDLERCISPEVPLLVPIPIRPVPLDRSKDLTKEIKDMDKENKNGIKDGVNGTKLRSFTPLKEAGNITVTLTLSSAAAEDIRGLLRNLANVLSIAAPTYQVIDKAGASIPEQKSHLYTIKGKDGKEKIDIQSILNGAAKFCRHCDVVVLSNVIKRKVLDFPGVQPTPLNGGDPSEDFYFCSTTCLMQFSITHGVTITEEKAATVVNHPGDTKNIKSEQRLKESKKNKLLDQKALDELKLKNKMKEDVDDKNVPKTDKRWKGSRYRNWGSTFIPQTKYRKPTDKEVTEMLFRLGITAMPSKVPLDTRECIFCHQPGDGVSNGPGRLLNFDVDKWVHLNCALWSDEVYETENGALVNVEVALKQSLTLACVVCKLKGATVKCFKTRCSQVYHLGCATKEGCIFYKNKVTIHHSYIQTIYCPAHIPKGEKENELTTLSVYRRVYIQRDENKQVAAVMHHADQHHLLRVGSLIFLNVGQLLPHQLAAFHTPNFIYPIGYKIARFYWSMRKVNKRCQYICSIHDVDAKPEFRITAQEEGFKEHVVKGNTAQAAWLQILETISKLRNSAEIIKVFPKYITGEDLFGLTEPSIVKVLESLPGIETLTDYHFKYGRNPLLELPLAINPTGCARSEPKLRTHFKRPHTQRTGPSRSTMNMQPISSEAACPYSKQFVHSKSSQYKKMKQEWRNNVYLARSKIQGLGLYAARDIEKHTMVIEYIGEIIRPELAELREKKYEASNRGIYMFRVDENRVIDATLCGGLARYINHSCNPNCVAETVEVDRDLRIIIFANRRISRGEELAYDYKFEFEDDQHKIPCLCGAPNCQQWMN
ncbi:Histone-lysine N-methyltransferase trr [Orchesella cincta]|uniref:Histone-lysine N-methyltransferase trr n=1 Tax=Orchesella cincta TaxID=48709 RepID=A0A1D2N5G3_ORCCI|nr:Histone-lysine N-methyltransferase trr [Orchesella cincta]